MRIVGKYDSHLFNQKGQAKLTFTIENFRHVGYLAELVSDKLYRLDIKEIKSARSIEQNKFMWALLHELAIVTQEDEWAWYIKALEDTDAKHEYVWALEGAEESLRNGFRAVKRVKPHRIKDTDGWLYKCFVGSSKMNKDEMTRLIDTVISYCNEHNINTDRRAYD